MNSWRGSNLPEYTVPDERTGIAGVVCRTAKLCGVEKRRRRIWSRCSSETMSSRQLHDIAPTSIRLQKGRQTKVHYERGKPPWIASRLQDFFGMRDTPRIGPRKTAVVVHLLAPNQRAVQTTTDLAGFWERLYPEVSAGLMRRYPRHAWPETAVSELSPLA